MKRLSKKWFKQIMIHITIKQELEELKKIVRIHTRATHPISYADVIIFLIKHYKDSLRIEYPLNQKLLVVNKLKQNNLSVCTPITPRPYSESVKLDGKTRASYSVES